MSNWKKLMLSAAGGGGAPAYVLQFRRPFTTTSYIDGNIGGNHSTDCAFDSGGNLFTIWRSINNSSSSYSAYRIGLSKFDSQGAFLATQKILYGYNKNTSGRIGSGGYGGHIVIDPSDNIYIIAGVAPAGNGGYIGKLANDLSSITYSNGITFNGSYLSGAVAASTSSLLVYTAYPNHQCSNINASTGSIGATGWLYGGDIGPTSANQVAANGLAYGGYDIMYAALKSSSGNLGTAATTSTTNYFSKFVNGYTNGQTASVGSTYNTGGATNVLYNGLFTGWGQRSGTYGTWLTEMTYNGTQVNNVFMPYNNSVGLFFPRGGPRRDLDGNTFVMYPNSAPTGYDGQWILVKYDSNFNISQALRMRVNGTAQYALQEQPSRNIAMSQDGSAIAFGFSVNDNNGVQGYFVQHLPTDISGISGTYNVPNQNQGFSGVTLTYDDVTSTLSGTEIVETSGPTNASTLKATQNHSNTTSTAFLGTDTSIQTNRLNL